MATKEPAPPADYIVTDKLGKKILKGPSSYVDCLAYAGVIRRGGGKVTIFRSTKG